MNRLFVKMRQIYVRKLQVNRLFLMLLTNTHDFVVEKE